MIKLKSRFVKNSSIRYFLWNTRKVYLCEYLNAVFDASNDERAAAPGGGASVRPIRAGVAGGRGHEGRGATEVDRGPVWQRACKLYVMHSYVTACQQLHFSRPKVETTVQEWIRRGMEQNMEHKKHKPTEELLLTDTFDLNRFCRWVRQPECISRWVTYLS